MSDIVKVKWIVETFGMRAVSGTAATLTLHYDGNQILQIQNCSRDDVGNG
jgi:hypothetical protein